MAGEARPEANVEAEFDWVDGKAKIQIEGKSYVSARLHPATLKDGGASKVLADFNIDGQTKTTTVKLIWWDVCLQWAADGVGRSPVFRLWKPKPKNT